jgi:formylglycine-generating enzyme required for sulfatase activity
MGKVAGQDTKQFPVEMVAWDDAVNFCSRLSTFPEEVAAERVYRLPSEAQWEYACRSGSEGRYCFGPGTGAKGEAILRDYGWVRDNAEATTHPVRKKLPNGWGLFDMHGNVWEWCSDWYDAEYYGKSPTTDPPGPAEGHDRVIRGNCWFRPAFQCRAAFRSHYSRANSLQGLRVSVALN